MFAVAEVSAAIYSILSGDSTLVSLVDDIRDAYALPDATDLTGEFKLVVIGDDSFDEQDDKTNSGWNGTVSVRVWWRDPATKGFGPLYQAASRIYELLHRQEEAVNDCLECSFCWMIQRESVRKIPEPDGLTRSVLLTFTVNTKEC